MENLEIYNALKQPPKEALRAIQGGRLVGKTDINPQWRYKAMTEQFGVCGVGWMYEIVRVFSEPASEGQVFAFAEVNLFIKQADKWSNPIPGYGGSMLVEKEKTGLHSSDEGYKMAITDALSVAMKMLGMAADVYAGLWDGTKYRDAPLAWDKGEIKGHWCSTHKTPFFKMGKMKAYAHPIKDESGADTGEWCNESKEKPEPELRHEEIDWDAIQEFSDSVENSSATPTGKKVQNITELKGLMGKHKIGTHEAYEILSISAFTDLVDLDEAWAKIKEAKGIE